MSHEENPDARELDALIEQWSVQGVEGFEPAFVSRMLRLLDDDRLRTLLSAKSARLSFLAAGEMISRRSEGSPRAAS